MQKSILATPSEKCTGCSVCQAICPTKAISMRLNTQGFYDPVLDAELCVQCGKCQKACPVEKNSPNQRLTSYYGWNKALDTLYNSTSGGAFRALADKILATDGIVYGAVYSGDYSEVLFSSSDIDALSRFQKSKYIVSNPQKVYCEVKQQLETGRVVLFSGAPCQVAGLTCFLGKDYGNLLTIDFVCGGMPSLRFWQEHTKQLEKKYNSKITSVDFRSKRFGWGKGYLEIHFENGKEYFSRDYLDSYYNCFACEHISVRKSCLGCEFHCKHFADITIADFWGYTKAGVSNVSGGVSLLIANSQKGEAFIREIENFEINLLENQYSDYAVAKETPDEKAIKAHNDFFAMADKYGFEKTAKKMCPATKLAHSKKYLKLKLGRK